MAKRKNESASAAKLKKQRLQEDRMLEGAFNTKEFHVESADEDNETSDWENQEQDYENIPRTLKTKKTIEGLPIKTLDGRIQRTIIEDEGKESDDEEASDEEAEIDFEDDKQAADTNDINHEEVYQQSDKLSDEEKLLQLQEDIAEMVEKLTEQPEENLHFLTRLRKMAQLKNANTSRFSFLALIPVFKNVVPGYKIRPLTEMEKKEKVSKDIARLRIFEEGILANYKSYVNLIVENSKKMKSNAMLARLSITSACELVSTLSHFNFVEDLLEIIIRFIFRFKGSLPKFYDDDSEQDRNVKVFNKCIAVLTKKLEEDVTFGKLSFDICRIISKNLKQRKFHCNKEVLALYLSLRILSDYDPQGSQGDEESNKLKLKKKNRVHLSKKERKARKERKEIEEEMRKAELQVSVEERDRNQAEILRIVLANYLQILKTQSDHLLATVLEGLAKYGFMANIELIGDFLTILKELITDISQEDHINDHMIKQILFCIITAFTLQSNSTSARVVKMDMSKFIDVLYSILVDISLDEEISKSIKLLIRTLESIFIKQTANVKIRNLAFTKKLYMLMLNTSEKPTLSILNFMNKFLVKCPEVKNLFSVEDRIANGVFNIDSPHLNRSNAEAATIWENCLLVNHYCPTIANSAKKVLKQSRSN